MIFDPLIKNKEEDPIWHCWLAHVAECRFCVRHAYTRGVDSERISELHDKFLETFDAVPQWKDGGFEKPKFHPGCHLGEALEEMGPFRGFWCFSWEAHATHNTPATPTRTKVCAATYLRRTCRF